jgi:type IV pilus assembly protein PilE
MTSLARTFKPYRGAVTARGFTLTELAVVMLVVGILSAIAYPLYTQQVLKARRGDALSLITAATQAQERYRMSRSTYTDDLTVLGIDASKISNHYSLAITGFSDGGSAASLEYGFVLTATPLSGSPQSADKRCGQLIASMGRGQLEYISKDSSGSVDTSKECWAK